MARSLNKVSLIGNLGNDPQARKTQSGTTVCNLRMATTEDWTDKGSGERKEHTEWHTVVFFGRMAEVCDRYLAKGSLIYVEGSIRTEAYHDKEGEKKLSFKIMGSRMLMLDSRNGGSREESGSPEAEARQAPNKAAVIEDDIPF